MKVDGSCACGYGRRFAGIKYCRPTACRFVGRQAIDDVRVHRDEVLLLKPFAGLLARAQCTCHPTFMNAIKETFAGLDGACPDAVASLNLSAAQALSSVSVEIDLVLMSHGQHHHELRRRDFVREDVP